MNVILQGANLRTGPSFSLSNRIMRAIWGIAWLLLFKITPRPFNAWRAWVLRLFGARIGKNFRIHGSCRIWAPWQLMAEDYASLGEGVHVYNMAPITLRARCVVSQGSHLCAGTHDYNSPNFQLYARPITIEADAWVCTEAFIGPGVVVPEGAVIGARAVLTKTPDQGQWRVFAGNPARAIKDRVRHTNQLD